MGAVFVDVVMSLDGYIAGPNAGPQNALGDGGERLHEWRYVLEAWRERQGREGGKTNPDDDVVRESFSRAGAFVMGRRMFDEGEGGWPDPPPFRAPVFVLTSSPRDPWVRQGGTTFTFVTDGIESAIDQAQQAAGGKDVFVTGGANVIQQSLNAGKIDDMQIHVSPVFLGAGVQLFSGVDPSRVKLEISRVVESAKVTHVKYRVTSRSATPEPKAKA